MILIDLWFKDLSIHYKQITGTAEGCALATFHGRYGYIGDVTKTSERTMLLSILGALGFVMMPLADFCGGQIYKAGKLVKLYYRIVISFHYS